MNYKGNHNRYAHPLVPPLVPAAQVFGTEPVPENWAAHGSRETNIQLRIYPALLSCLVSLRPGLGPESVPENWPANGSRELISRSESGQESIAVALCVCGREHVPEN
jgi:hypothetical protein